MAGRNMEYEMIEDELIEDEMVCKDLKPCSSWFSRCPTSEADDAICLIGIYGSISLVLLDAEGVVEHLRTIKTARNTTVVAASQQDKAIEILNYSPCKLGHMYWFQKLLQEVQSEAENVVICTGDNPQTITSTALLLGCIMILMDDMNVQVVEDSFRAIFHRFVSFSDGKGADSGEVTVQDCWRAMFRAKQLGWVDFKSPQVDIDRCIDMQECLHYDIPSNGGIHVIIPSKLLSFQGPPETRSNQENTPKLSTHVLSEILKDFDVRVVVTCGPPGTRTAALIQRAGLWSEALPTSAGGCAGSPLQAVDRFLSLLRLAPGCVALVAGGGGGLGPAAEPLVAAALISLHGFPPREALAWVRLVHSGAALLSVRFTSAAPPRAPATTARVPARRPSITRAPPPPAALRRCPSDLGPSPPAVAGDAVAPVLRRVASSGAAEGLGRPLDKDMAAEEAGGKGEGAWGGVAAGQKGWAACMVRLLSGLVGLGGA